MATYTIHVLDDYYLGITLLITILFQLSFFFIAFTFNTDKFTDFAGGANFVTLAVLTLGLSGANDVRQVVVSSFLIAWTLRLTSFLFYRVLKTGKDDRFDNLRDKFWSFAVFWFFQIIWVWTVSLPVTILNSPNVQWYSQVPFGTWRDIAGVVLYAIGILMETASDVQRYIFRSSHDKWAFCDKGLFYFSRHPNYFGEIMIHFSIFMVAVSPAADGFVAGGAYKALYATILSPIITTFFLMFVSGVPLSERPGAKRRYDSGKNWAAYERYLQRTSVLIPLPPQLYSRLPIFIKRTILMEFPMYVFDPNKHSNSAMNKQLAKEKGSADRGKSQDGLVSDEQ